MQTFIDSFEKSPSRIVWSVRGWAWSHPSSLIAEVKFTVLCAILFQDFFLS